MILSIFGSNLADSMTMAPGRAPAVFSSPAYRHVPALRAAINHVLPSQLNVQIPFETPVNQLATVVVNNNGRTASKTSRSDRQPPGCSRIRAGRS